MKRVLVPAALAIVVLLCAATGAWAILVHGIGSAIGTQGRLAREVLDARVPFTDSLARTLLVPGLHVVLADRRDGSVIDATTEGIQHHGPPPDGAPPRPVPGEGPPGPPPDGPPREGQPRDVPPPPPIAPRSNAGQGRPIDAYALSLARLRPVRADDGQRWIDVSPDVSWLALWLRLDALATMVGTLAIVAIAVRRVAANARRDRAALEARVAERDEAAMRYQRFLAETGHELRTPLTVMMGYVDILRARASIPEIDRRIFDSMYAETTRMRGLVEKMMTLARLESTAAVPRLVDVGTAVREAVQTLRRRYPERAIDARTDEGGSIVIDADDLAAAIGNLLENAVRYAPDSPITVTTAARDGAATIAVLDRGPGIAAADRERIFDRFKRGEGRAYGEGLGLGLAIVRRVTDRWNGTVTCESAAGRTEFRLTFPLADEERDGIAR